MTTTTTTTMTTTTTTATATINTNTNANTTILAEECVHFNYSLKLVKAALPDIQYSLYTAHSIG